MMYKEFFIHFEFLFVMAVIIAVLLVVIAIQWAMIRNYRKLIKETVYFLKEIKNQVGK